MLCGDGWGLRGGCECGEPGPDPCVVGLRVEELSLRRTAFSSDWDPGSSRENSPRAARMEGALGFGPRAGEHKAQTHLQGVSEKSGQYFLRAGCQGATVLAPLALGWEKQSVLHKKAS